ncbi:hypothetical protein Tco_0949344 [Tanacetum coccineum]
MEILLDPTSNKLSVGIMEMKSDIKNMTLNEYLEYEAEKERIRERDNDLEEDQEDDGDDRHTFDMWDITVEDIERIRQFLTPNIPDIIEDGIKPLIPTTLHTTPTNKDYVAPATKPILDGLLEDKILNVAMVDEEADPTRDLKEPERLLVEDPNFMFRLVGYHANDDDGIFVIMDVARKANLKHGLEHVVSLSYRAKSKGVSCSNSTLSIIFQFLTVQ